MFILCSNCRILLVRCDDNNSSVVMFTSKASSSSPTTHMHVVDSGDNGGANGFRVAAEEDHHEEEQYLDILMSALNITKLPDIAKVRLYTLTLTSTVALTLRMNVVYCGALVRSFFLYDFDIP